MAETQNNSVEVVGCRLIFKNFAGRKDKFNEEGRRHVSIVLSEQQADELAEQGYNVKSRPPRQEGDDTLYHLKLNVKFDTAGRPPRVVMVTKKKQTRLDEDIVDLLDDLYIERANVRFRAWEYEPGKRSAYLQTLFAVVQEDTLGAEFEDIPMDGGHAEPSFEEETF